MLAFLLPWLRSPNAWAGAILVGLCVAAFAGTYIAGIRHEQRKWVLQMAAKNAPIVEQRGADVAEMAAEEEKAAAVDAAVKAALKQRFVLDAETAKLLSSVR
jgi:hypothetical protein